MKQQRLIEIEKYLVENEIASIEKLSSYFNVSINTIRRDINELEDQGVITKIYGGVKLNKRSEKTEPFNTRQIKNINSKEKIGLLAAQLVKDRDIIFIDSGTTTLQILPYICDMDIVIVTNNLNVIVDGIKYPELNIISTGGKLYRLTNSFIGTQAIDIIKSLNIQKAFMAATGISITKGCTNSSSLENEVKRAVVEQSEQIYVLTDYSKYDVISLMSYTSLENINGIFTDIMPPSKYLDFFKKHNILVNGKKV